MEIQIPEGISTGELRLLPEGTARAMLDKIMIGQTMEGKPKATFRYILTEEMANVKPGDEPTTGAFVLETMSLQPQALFALAKTWKDATGENLPQGDFNEETFSQLLNDTLTGTEWDLLLVQEIPKGQTETRTVIKKKTIAKRN